MPSQLPIACSLTAAELPGRLAEMAAVGRSALVAVESKGAQAVLRFRERSDTRERLQALVAAFSGTPEAA